MSAAGALLTSEELSFILKAGEGTHCQAGKTSPEGDGREINMKKALKITGISLALVILAALLVEFFFWPSYMLSEKRAVPGEDNDDEITVMSYNIRYFNPLDIGKRSWFYRASLVTEDVARVQPDIIGFQEVTWVHQGYLERTMEGYTYHAWGEKLDNERIDYIMVSGDASRILEYRRVDNLHGGVYASDHAPIYVKLRVG